MMKIITACAAYIYALKAFDFDTNQLHIEVASEETKGVPKLRAWVDVKVKT